MPQPRSSTAKATASGSYQARTTIGVSGPLYLQAFSSRLSSNWPSSGRWARVQSGSSLPPWKCRSAARSWPDQVAGGRRPRRRGRGVRGRAARPRRRPGRGTAAPRRPARAGRRRRGAGPGCARAHDGARAAAGDLDRGDQGGQRGAELVRRLAGELPLPLQRHVEAVEQPVEAAGEVLQLVARPWAGQPAVVEGHCAGRLGHEGQRGEGASGEMAADRRGQCPEAKRDQRQDGRQRSDLGLHRLQ